MSCGCASPRFRLLDGLVGWDSAAAEGITGKWALGGISLARRDEGEDLPDRELWPYLPPPHLAYDCRECRWYLATPHPPASRLLTLGPCDACDSRWPAAPIDASDLRDVVAIAARDGFVAAADRTRREVRVWTSSGALIGVYSAPEPPTHVAFFSSHELVVVVGDGEIHRIDLAGIPVGRVAIYLEDSARITAIGVSGDEAIWAVVDSAAGGRRLLRWRAGKGWHDATIADLRAALPDTGLTLVTPAGFCIRRPARNPRGEQCCVTTYGRPGVITPPPARTDLFVSQGQLLTDPIDSGIPRCRWHRVRIDADVPAGTSLEIAVAATETIEGAAQGQADPEWPGFATGYPYPSDWQAVTGSSDFLINQPAGRYLFVRIRMTSEGQATPVVRRVRLDFPRATSVDAIPDVYREDPRAEDFTERFVSLVDAALEDLDEAVTRFPALLDVERSPDDVLPWIGRFFGAALDSAWDATRRRAILAQLPTLYRLRGTPAGLSLAVELVFGAAPAIEEEGASSLFAAVANADRRSALDARLGGVRLFGRGRARFRVGGSALSRTPVRSYGDASLDPLTEGAYRIRVSLPSQGTPTRSLLQRLRALVDSQKPAHVVASVRSGSGIVVVGSELRAGIDTRLGAPPPSVLDGTLRLGRNSILRGRRREQAAGHTNVMSVSC